MAKSVYPTSLLCWPNNGGKKNTRNKTKQKTFCRAKSVYQQNWPLTFTPQMSALHSCPVFVWTAVLISVWIVGLGHVLWGHGDLWRSHYNQFISMSKWVSVSDVRELHAVSRQTITDRPTVRSWAVKVRFSYPPSIISSTTRNTPSMLSSKYRRSTFFLQRKVQLAPGD